MHPSQNSRFFIAIAFFRREKESKNVPNGRIWKQMCNFLNMFGSLWPRPAQGATPSLAVYFSDSPTLTCEYCVECFHVLLSESMVLQSLDIFQSVLSTWRKPHYTQCKLEKLERLLSSIRLIEMYQFLLTTLLSFYSHLQPHSNVHPLQFHPINWFHMFNVVQGGPTCIFCCIKNSPERSFLNTLMFYPNQIYAKSR